MDIKLIPLTATDEDIKELQRIHSTPTVKKWITVSEDYFTYVTSSDAVIYYKIFSDDALCGGLQCETDGDTAYLCICIDEPYRKRGIAEAALRQLPDILPRSIKRTEASIDEANIPSRCLFEKAGFVMEGKEDNLLTYMKCVNGDGSF